MNDARARAKLEQIAADIKSGKTTFDKAAKEFSQDPGSANRGGDLGWATPDIFDPAFRDALMRLNKGQTSGPVHSSFGWHPDPTDGYPQRRQNRRRAERPRLPHADEPQIL